MRTALRRMAPLLLASAGCTEPAERPGWPAGAFDGAGGEEIGFRDTARPWIIGHRGTGADGDGEPRAENTIPAALHAIVVEGAVGVEIDVMLTRDLEVVLMHDPRLDRTTDCRGCVSERTLAEVQACRTVGGDRPGAHPPSLAEALAALDALPVEPLIMLDSKLAPMEGCPIVVRAEEHATTLGRRLGEEVLAAGLAHTSAVQGPADLLRAAREAAPGITTLVAHRSMIEAVRIARGDDLDGVAVGLEKLREEAISAARDSDQLIDTFVVNAPVDLSVAVLCDVDVIETDRVPEVLASFSE